MFKKEINVRFGSLVWNRTEQNNMLIDLIKYRSFICMYTWTWKVKSVEMQTKEEANK